MTYEQLLALGDAVGHVSRGAAQHVLDRIPRGRYARGRKGEDEQCAVCREEFAEGDTLMLLPCKHFYHEDCLGQALLVHKVRECLLPPCLVHGRRSFPWTLQVCPMCKFEVTDDTIPK